jgi:cytochrome b6-f complex iron-sulfur subunit
MGDSSTDSKATWTRRLFVKDSLIGWLALVVGPTAYALYARSEHRTSRGTESEMDLGVEREFQSGTAREFRFNGKSVLVARLADNEWAAVSSVCTHLGCSVRMERQSANSDRVFACNCHESSFGVDGTNLTGPAPYPLKRYSVEVREGRVILAEPDAHE